MASASDESLTYVTSVADFDDHDRVLVDVNGREVAVFEVDGEFHAVLNICPHQGGPVGEGVVAGTFELPDSGTAVSDLEYSDDDSYISCPWHGWEFDLSTGTHRSHPAYRLPTYDVIVEDGEIYLNLGT